MTSRQAVISVVMVVLSLTSVTLSFQPLGLFDKKSISHREITQRAVLRKTAEVCRDIAASNGEGFSLTIDNSLSVDEVQTACSSAGTSTSLRSSVTFHTSIATMFFSNADVDFFLFLSPVHHFDDESFHGGRDLIKEGVHAVKKSVEKDNFIIGRITLGSICHTLQDFYSHSNWIELENTVPYSALIRPDRLLKNLAGPNTPTCRNCTGGNCDDNLLPEVKKNRLITSGYFSLTSSVKPPGKCSHGGTFDRTSRRDPVGGINKDSIGSDHGSLHPKAADLAVIATMELLEDIRIVVGDEKFLRLMGLSQSSALCLVIDTTGSMSDDIAEAKEVSFDIIDSKKGTPYEPSAYILVPFNDPDFGPVIRTTDADVFKASINKLTAFGGGDFPEMSLSGLQLALTSAPPSSEVFVFTDAPAKDAHLKSAITALIESTKSQITFMLTGGLARRRRRRDGQSAARAMSRSDAQLYSDLAQASGGQNIQVTKSDFSLATSVIRDSSASAVVTVFQVVKNPGKPENFTFNVDTLLSNVTAYITGASSLTFSLTSPTGVSQSSTQSIGPLASFSTVGNLRRLSLNTDNQTGLWQITVISSNPYSVKITGQSSVNFIYNLVEAHEGAHADFNQKEGRLLSGGNASILITVTGSEPVSVTEIMLYDNSGPTTVNGSLQSLGRNNFLVTFSGVPAGKFVLLLKGEGTSTSSRSIAASFQRQASTEIKTSILSVTVSDVARPVCQVVSTLSNCISSSSSLCASSQWEFIANLTDGINGTGIESITIRRGNGTLNTSIVVGAEGENVTMVTYSASCCSPTVELAAVDGAGNAGICVGQARIDTTAASITTATTASVTTGSVSTTSTGGNTPNISQSLWIILLSLIWKFF
ncbi:von Willebrand factor A domain-containing protein 7 isoform 2-T2 [Pholidichthys leucotaenia]